MISVKNVDFAYGTRPILKNVSFEVTDSESLAIMGPSGSGKSTILRLILGLECPSTGAIEINGQNICAMKEKQKREIRKSIGMVFQDGALFDSMTVGENVGYYLLEHTKLSWEEISERVYQMLGFVGLDPDEIGDQLPDQLSGGMRRRVAIGRALLSTNPQLMLYDEPTTGLDPIATEKVMALIKKLHKEHSVASIVVTHQIADAIAIADRFVVIIEGEVVFDDDLDKLRSSQEKTVVEFLKPFIESFKEVTRRNFA